MMKKDFRDVPETLDMVIAKIVAKTVGAIAVLSMIGMVLAECF